MWLSATGGSAGGGAGGAAVHGRDCSGELRGRRGLHYSGQHCFGRGLALWLGNTVGEPLVEVLQVRLERPAHLPCRAQGRRRVGLLVRCRVANRAATIVNPAGQPWGESARTARPRRPRALGRVVGHERRESSGPDPAVSGAPCEHSLLRAKVVGCPPRLRWCRRGSGQGADAAAREGGRCTGRHPLVERQVLRRVLTGLSTVGAKVARQERLVGLSWSVCRVRLE